jgi:hypothetical protein
VLWLNEVGLDIVCVQLEELGFEPTGVHGPYFWRLPTARLLWGEPESVEADEKATEVQGAVASRDLT